MSRDQGSRRTGRRRGSPGAGAAATPTRASKLGIAFALFLGLFLGRAFSNNLSSEALGAIDLVMFAGLAATMALGFRRWARRTIEDRERRRRRQQRAASNAAPASDDTPPASSTG